MIKNKENTTMEIVIDLTGSDGNVFYLIGQGRRFCKQLGINSEMFSRRMMSGDYENAVATFEEYFGDYVTLYR